MLFIFGIGNYPGRVILKTVLLAHSNIQKNAEYLRWQIATSLFHRQTFTRLNGPLPIAPTARGEKNTMFNGYLQYFLKIHPVKSRLRYRAFYFQYMCRPHESREQYQFRNW